MATKSYTVKPGGRFARDANCLADALAPLTWHMRPALDNTTRGTASLSRPASMAIWKYSYRSKPVRCYLCLAYTTLSLWLTINDV